MTVNCKRRRALRDEVTPAIPADLHGHHPGEERDQDVRGADELPLPRRLLVQVRVKGVDRIEHVVLQLVRFDKVLNHFCSLRVNDGAEVLSSFR